MFYSEDMINLIEMTKKFFAIAIILLFLSQSQVAHAAEINIFEKTGYSVEDFNKMLKNTNLENKGEYFKNMEDEHNVNGVFAMSVASYESAFPTKKINSSNNLFGMMSNGKLIKFSSVSDNVLAFGDLMNKATYKNKSITSIAKIYCPPNSKNWINNINSRYNGFVDKL